MKLEEEIVHKFPYRCPYCDQVISYDQFDLKIRENEIQCPSCKKIYIKVVSDISSPPHAPRGVHGSPGPDMVQGRPSPIRGEGKC